MLYKFIILKLNYIYNKYIIMEFVNLTNYPNAKLLINEEHAQFVVIPDFYHDITNEIDEYCQLLQANYDSAKEAGQEELPIKLVRNKSFIMRGKKCHMNRGILFVSDKVSKYAFTDAPILSVPLNDTFRNLINYVN